VAGSHNPTTTGTAWRVAACLGACATLIAGAQLAVAGEPESALILKIGKFVEWPPAAFSGPRGELHLCIAGSVQGDEALDALNGRRLQDRLISVEHLVSNDDAAGCQILFVSRSEHDRVAQWLAPLADRPVLTVSDMEGFVAAGGMIGIKIEHGRIGFAINRPASNRSGLTIGAQLMQVAATGVQGGKR
jgi:hypothetical protein